MFITVHAAAAAVIGKKVASAPLAFLLGFILHFLLDIIPHGDENLGKKFFGLDMSRLFNKENSVKSLALYGSLDACALVVFLLFLFRNFNFANSDSVSWAMIGGILPDILVAIYQLGKIRQLKWFNDLHFKNHHLLLNRMKSDIPLYFGLALQIIALTMVIWLIYFL